MEIDLQCSNMSPRAWEGWVESDGIRAALWRGKERLKLAWRHDQDDPKSYPMNTWSTLAEIQQNVSPRIARNSSTMPRTVFKNPKMLAELVPVENVKTIWEENHNCNFETAIIRATPTNYSDQKKSWRVFKRIIHTMEIAYLVDYWGWELLPKPKVNILHRGLDKIAKTVGLGDQIDKGFAEFLDDLCPCGLRRHEEAVRKLRSRINHRRRST